MKKRILNERQLRTLISSETKKVLKEMDFDVAGRSHFGADEWERIETDKAKWNDSIDKEMSQGSVKSLISQDAVWGLFEDIDMYARDVALKITGVDAEGLVEEQEASPVFNEVIEESRAKLREIIENLAKEYVILVNETKDF